MTWLIKAMLVPYCGPFPGPLPSLRCLVSVCAFCDLAALLMDSMLMGIRHIYTYGARLIVLFWHFYPTVFGIFEAFVWGKVWSCLSFLFLNIGFQIYYGLIVDPWYWSMWWFRKRASFGRVLKIAAAQRTFKPRGFISFLWALAGDGQKDLLGSHTYNHVLVLLIFFPPLAFCNLMSFYWGKKRLAQCNLFFSVVDVVNILQVSEAVSNLFIIYLFFFFLGP